LWLSGVIILGLTYPLANFQIRYRVQGVMLFVSGPFFPVIFTLSQSKTKEEFASVVSYITIVIQLTFFASPLLNAIEIVKAKSSATLYWPLALTASINCALWTMYEIVLDQLTIFLPNVIACVFA
jgi:uncharacterized protein with PQ loop repeat